MTSKDIIYAQESTYDRRGIYSIPTQISEHQRYIQKNGYSSAGDLLIPTFRQDPHQDQGGRVRITGKDLCH
jgi:hypothetical protein